jgi:hypothetical protein
LDIHKPPDGGRQRNDVSPFGTAELVERGELGLAGGDGALDAVTQPKPGVAADVLQFVMESRRALLASSLALIDARTRRIGPRRTYMWIC